MLLASPLALALPNAAPSKTVREPVRVLAAVGVAVQAFGPETEMASETSAVMIGSVPVAYVVRAQTSGVPSAWLSTVTGRLAYAGSVVVVSVVVRQVPSVLRALAVTTLLVEV